MKEIALALALMDLLDKLIPRVRDQINGGELNATEEAEAREVYLRMRQSSDKYSGPDYELSGR